MQKVVPSPDDCGQRLDRYLRKIFPGAKLGEIYEALRKKKITVNGKKMPENTRLRSGDTIELGIELGVLEKWGLDLKEGRMSKSGTNDGSRTPPRFAASKRRGLGGVVNDTLSTIHYRLDPSRILFEDADIFVYDKPAGLIVHGPDHKTDEVALIDQIEDYLREHTWKPSGTFRHPALAHRIDRDTSGVIISCLNRKSYEYMAEQFRTRKVKKIYHALVAGIPEPREGVIDAPLLRIDEKDSTEAKVIVDPKGQQAETHYKVLKEGNGWSLVECQPKTGRTHQIRVHMSHIGHPLIGDRRYGGPSVTRFPELSHLHDRRGHLLHAVEIQFNFQGKPITITSKRDFATEKIM